MCPETTLRTCECTDMVRVPDDAYLGAWFGQCGRCKMTIGVDRREVTLESMLAADAWWTRVHDDCYHF